MSALRGPAALDVAPTFQSAGREAFQPPVPRKPRPRSSATVPRGTRHSQRWNGSRCEQSRRVERRAGTGWCVRWYHSFRPLCAGLFCRSATTAVPPASRRAGTGGRRAAPRLVTTQPGGTPGAHAKRFGRRATRPAALVSLAVLLGAIRTRIFLAHVVMRRVAVRLRRRAVVAVARSFRRHAVGADEGAASCIERLPKSMMLRGIGLPPPLNNSSPLR